MNAEKSANAILRGNEKQKIAKEAAIIICNAQVPEDVGAKLHRRFLDGDENAFAELLGLYRESLTRYINEIVNDMHEAEELMLVAFAELAADTKFEARAQLKTYLFGIGRRLALRRVKSRSYSHHVPIDDLIYLICGDDGQPEAYFLNDERKERLLAAMKTLKPEYREVLRLLYFDNMTYMEAGMTMGKTQKQITNLAYRAKISLKKKLGGEEADI